MGMKGNHAGQKIIDSLELPITVDEYLEKHEKNCEKLFPTADLLPGIFKKVKDYQKEVLYCG